MLKASQKYTVELLIIATVTTHMRTVSYTLLIDIVRKVYVVTYIAA